MEAEQFLKENYNQLYHLLKQDETGFDFMEDYANQSKWISVENPPIQKTETYKRGYSQFFVGYNLASTEHLICYYDFVDCTWFDSSGNHVNITHYQTLPIFTEPCQIT